MRRTRLQKLTACALCTAVCAVCAQITIPFGGVPLTLQTFAVAFCGALLGLPLGLLPVLGYLVLGAVGVPVFSAFSGGIFVLAGQNGGFLWGFLLLALGCGLCKNRSLWKRLLSCGIGLLLCHLAGVLWYREVTGLSLWASILSASLPFLFKDTVSVWLACFVAKRLEKLCTLFRRA